MLKAHRFESGLLGGCNLRFPFFLPPPPLPFPFSTPYTILPQTFTTPNQKCVPRCKRLWPMGPIVADGSLLVTGRGGHGRPRGLISNNKGVILMFIIVILSTLFLGGKHWAWGLGGRSKNASRGQACPPERTRGCHTLSSYKSLFVRPTARINLVG